MWQPENKWSLANFNNVFDSHHAKNPYFREHNWMLKTTETKQKKTKNEQKKKTEHKICQNKKIVISKMLILLDNLLWLQHTTTPTNRFEMWNYNLLKCNSGVRSRALSSDTWCDGKMERAKQSLLHCFQFPTLNHRQMQKNKFLIPSSLTAECK